MVKVRLMGSKKDVRDALDDLLKIWNIVSISPAYKNSNSENVRIYVEIE
jgi:hypothetical protein